MLYYRTIVDDGTQLIVRPPEPVTPLESERLLAEHSLIGAVKCYRNRTGLGLAESKHAIDRVRPPGPSAACIPGALLDQAQTTIGQLEHQLTSERANTAYWRDKYVRLHDAMRQALDGPRC